MKTLDEIREYLTKHQLCVELSEEGDNVVVSIEWGDWKHDHMFCDYLMEQIGYKSDGEYITEEDGSDTYSADHYYKPF